MGGAGFEVLAATSVTDEERRNAEGAAGTLPHCIFAPFEAEVKWAVTKEQAEITIVVRLMEGMPDSYAALIDVQVSVGEVTKSYFGELVLSSTPRSVFSRFPLKKRRSPSRNSASSTAESTSCHSVPSLEPCSAQAASSQSEATLPIRVESRCRQMLARTDLSQKSNLRSLQIICASREWFVDVQRLKEYGGPLFEEWVKQAEEQGARQVVSHEDPGDLACLLDSLFAYDFVIVHSGNWRQLVEIAERLRLHPLLRAIEAFLLECGNFHPVRLLELSVELRMARLYDTGIKRLGSPIQALRQLHQYLSNTGGTLADLHPKLRGVFKLSDRTVVIG